MTILATTVAGAALQALWASVVDTTALAALVWLAIALLRPTAHARHLLWWLVVAVAVVAPCTSFATSLGHRHVIVFASAKHGASLPVAGGVPTIDFTIAPSTIFESLVAIWLGIAICKYVSLTFDLIALARLKRRATSLDGATAARLDAWRRASGIGRSPALRISGDVRIPCAAGLWSPTVLLPTAIVADQSAADIDRVAMHEYAHFARYDDWSNFCERVVAATFWFNPALAFANARIAIDREIACDDWVVARTGGAHAHASCLFRLAEGTRFARPAAQALPILGNARHTSARIEHLLEPTAPRRHGFARPIYAAIATAALALIVAQAMWAPAIAVEVQSDGLAAPAAPPNLLRLPPLPPLPPLDVHVPRIVIVRSAVAADAAIDDSDQDRLRQIVARIRSLSQERASNETARDRALLEADRERGDGLLRVGQ